MSSGFMVPTGKIINEYLAEHGIRHSDLPALGFSRKQANDLKSGKIKVDKEIAEKLETIITGIPASYWLNLENEYTQYINSVKQGRTISGIDSKTISSRFRLDDVFKGLDWDFEKKAYEMLKLLHIPSFADFDRVYSKLAVNFMEDGGEKEAIAIWLNLCEQEVELQNDDLDNIKFNKNQLELDLPNFKRLALGSDVKASLHNARKLCNNLGIYLVECEAIVKSKVRGALTTYKSHPAIYLSWRFKTHDHIWFALIHEIGHILLHYDPDSVSTIISLEEESEPADRLEYEANAFARDFFISPASYSVYVKKGDFTSLGVDTFARSEKVQPGIVVARLQHDGYIRRDELNYKKKSI